MDWIEAKPLPAWVDARNLESQLERALQEPFDATRSSWQDNPLRRLIRAWFAEGLDEGEVLGICERFRARLQGENREADEDAILDLMDCLVGWCSPDACLRRKASGEQGMP